MDHTSLTVVVDANARPRIPSDFSLEGMGTEHRKLGTITLEKRDGKLYANGDRVIRHRSPNQRGRTIKGYKLREELKSKLSLNACIKDALLINPELIPDEWKGGSTHFWGTIFRNASGFLCVVCLYWCDSGWGWSYRFLGSDWDKNMSAAELEDLPLAV